MSDKKVILVVDDSASMRASAKSALSPEFEVVTAEDGVDAIGMLASVKPDLLLIDIVMPNLDGYQTVSMIRLNDSFKAVPIVMMSSKGSVLDVARGKLIGFDGSIQKPFQAEDLVQVVREYLAGAGVVSGAEQ